MQQFRDVVLSPLGRPIVGATVTVTLAAGGAASLYSDNGTTALGSNVLTTDENGEYVFYAANGRYTLTIAASGYTTTTRDEVLWDHADLASTASTALGDALVGVKLAATGAAARTQHDKNADTISITDFVDADPTAATDSTSAVNAALSTAAVLRLPLNINGRFLYGSTLVIPARVALRGTGWTSDSATSGRSHSCLIKNFDGVGVLFSGDDASTDGVQFDSIAGKTGDVVQVTGSRARLLNGASTNGGGDGVRIGKTEAGASSINANCGVLCNWQSLNNGGWGVQFDHTNTSTSGTFPLGAPDCNAWTVSHVLLGASTQPNVSGGLKVGNSIDNVFINVVSQDNTGPSAKFTTGARGHVLEIYSEGNGSGPVFDSGASNNTLVCLNTLITGNDPTDNDGSNQITRAISAVAGRFSNFLRAGNLAASGFADVILTADVNAIDAVKLRGSQSTGSRGRATIQTKTNGGALADRLTIDELMAAFTNISTGILFGKDVFDTTTSGVQIMDGATARINAVNTGTSATTVAAFYNGNGQVGTISTSGSATTYATSSDYRLKSDVQAADGAAALAAVMSWPIKSFKWTASGAPDIGVIAHELQAVKPAAVVGVKDGADMQGVDYSKLVPELVAAVQYLAAEVATLKGNP